MGIVSLSAIAPTVLKYLLFAPSDFQKNNLDTEDLHPRLQENEIKFAPNSQIPNNTLVLCFGIVRILDLGLDIFCFTQQLF